MPQTDPVVSVLERAYAAARAALEQTYEGRCTVYAYKEAADEQTGLSRAEEAVVLRDVPCRLSFETWRPADVGELGAALDQVVRLFTAPETPVPAGAKVVVEQRGKKAAYLACGPGAVYRTHAETVLLLAQQYA